MYPKVLSLAFCFAPSTHWPLATLITTMACRQLHAEDPSFFWPRVLLSSCPSQPTAPPTEPLHWICQWQLKFHVCKTPLIIIPQPMSFFRVHILKAQHHHSSSLPYQKAGCFSRVGAANSNACEGTQAFFNLRNKYTVLNTVISM